MTNREKWTPNMSDKLIEMAICDNFIRIGCECCPITAICEPYTEGQCSDDAYMAAVTEWLEWLDEEAE